MYKKAWCTCKVVVFLIKPLFFWRSRCRPRRCLKSPLVSLRNRTAERRGRQNASAWQTWQGYYLRFSSWSSPNTNVFWSLQKDLFKGEWSLAKTYFKQNYCHTCHTRFAVRLVAYTVRNPDVSYPRTFRTQTIRTQSWDDSYPTLRWFVPKA